MSAGETPGADAPAWFVEARHAGTRPRTRPTSRLRRDGAIERSGRVVIVSSLFLLLIAVAVVVGGQNAVDPLVRSVIAARESRSVGDIVLTMPDGIYCRHMSFDNATAELAAGSMKLCGDDVVTGRSHVEPKFSWSTH